MVKIDFKLRFQGLWDGKSRPSRPARGPKQADTGRAGMGLKIQARAPLRTETGLMIFYLRFLCSLCAGRWVVTRELRIVVTCKCVVFWANVNLQNTPKFLRTMPNSYQNQISIIISVVLLVLLLNIKQILAGAQTGPNGPKIKNCIMGRAGGGEELRAGPKNTVILTSL